MKRVDEGAYEGVDERGNDVQRTDSSAEKLWKVSEENANAEKGDASTCKSGAGVSGVHASHGSIGGLLQGVPRLLDSRTRTSGPGI